MEHPQYNPPLLLKNGLLMTLYIGLIANHTWEKTINIPEPDYQEHIFYGAGGVPIFGIVSSTQPRGTIIGTYGITGDLDNQWYLKIFGRKAFAQGYGVILFDWRAHGKTAQLSSTLTSDGIYEGEDFVRIAAQAKANGFQPPFYFTGYSLGGQLALWGIKAAQTWQMWGKDLDLQDSDLGGGAVICPNIDANRSLSYLVKDPLGRYLEQAIAKKLKQLAWQIHNTHPGALDPQAIERANTIEGFDHELVIKPLGFSSVQEYYAASSPLNLLPQLNKPTLILYAADDPMFDPTIIPDLQVACADNPHVDLLLTTYGGHVSYLSSKACQHQSQDPDPWWGWNRILNFFNSCS